MDTVTVNVTQEHIDEGESCDCSYCPVALALRESLPVCEPVVDAAGFVSLIEFTDAETPMPVRVLEGELPEEAMNFVCLIDAGGRDYAKPFSFALNVKERPS